MKYDRDDLIRKIDQKLEELEAFSPADTRHQKYLEAQAAYEEGLATWKSETPKVLERVIKNWKEQKRQTYYAGDEWRRVMERHAPPSAPQEPHGRTHAEIEKDNLTRSLKISRIHLEAAVVDKDGAVALTGEIKNLPDWLARSVKGGDEE